MKKYLFAILLLPLFTEASKTELYNVCLDTASDILKNGLGNCKEDNILLFHTFILDQSREHSSNKGKARANRIAIHQVCSRGTERELYDFFSCRLKPQSQWGEIYKNE